MGDVKPLLAVTGTRREAALLAGRGMIVLAGGGDEAALAARIAEVAGDVAAIISFGMAGSLVRQLTVGDVVVGTRVVGGAEADCDPRWVEALCAALPRAKAGVVHAEGRLISNRGRKVALSNASAAVCADMESHVAGAAALAHGLRFAILRGISDAHNRSLPPAIAVAMAPGGALALGAVLGSVLRQPLQVPWLIGTGIGFSRGFTAYRRALRRLDARLAFDARGELPGADDGQR